MVATKSPDGVISYIEEKFDLTIDEWIAAVQYELCRKQKLPQSKLKAGSFAYDNLATLVYELLNHVHLRTFILQHQVQPMCEALHQTWCKHYCSWRDQTPWTKHPSYIKPAQALGDERRNKLCTTKFQQLPQEENIKYQTIVNVIYERLQPVMVQKKEEEENVQKDEVEEPDEEMQEENAEHEQEPDGPEPEQEMQEENAEQEPEVQEHVQDAEQENEDAQNNVDTRMQDESVDDIDNDNMDNTCMPMQTTQPDEEQEQEQPDEEQITLSANQLALGPPTFEPAQLQVINMLILKLSKDLTIPEKELRVLATEHWGQNFESLGFVVKEVKRKPSASKQPSQAVDASSTGCTYRYRKNHKTKGGQVCNQPCVKNATLCYEHNRKKILASKD